MLAFSSEIDRFAAVSYRRSCPKCGETYDESVAFCAKDGSSLTIVDESDLVGKVGGGRYRVISRIGEGGMGQVYLAEHIRMKRKSAIKIMRQALLHEPEALQRFTREAENASKINHPNVAAIFDFGETDEGLVYLAMEFVDGEALAATLKREVALHPVVGADIIAQAADALQSAHDLGILHRDIKPDNVMVSKRTDGTFVVKLVDFGIARSTDRSAQQVTRTGFAVGTPEYMSPEQLSGDVLDPRSDQYSLALVAFMALTGHDAFVSASSKESLIARLTSRPRRLVEVRSDLEWPLSLQDVFDKALAPDPVDRYPTISEFGNTLADSVSEMTPTQTAEIYRHALGQRMSSNPVVRTQMDAASVRTPAAGNNPQRQQPAAPPPVRHSRKDPVHMGRRRSVFPYIVLLGVFTYALWWYGASRPEGTTMHNVSDRIGDVSSKARSTIAGWVGSDSTAAEAPPSETAAPAAAPKRTRRRNSETEKTTKPDSAVSAVVDSSAIKRDTTVPPT